MSIKEPDIVTLLARIVAAQSPELRSRLIRKLPWSRMSMQSRAIALKYLPVRDGNPGCSNMHPQSRRRRAVRFLRQYEKDTSGNAGRRLSLTLE